MKVSFSFQQTLHPIQFNMSATLESPITGVFGPSGCGKTTLLHMIAGLSKPEAGHLTINGRELFNADKDLFVPPHQREIAVVFQEGRLFPHLSVRQNLTYGMSTSPHGAYHLNDVVNWLHLESLLDTPPMSLSGGERQRVALGRALLSYPRLLLLDEPLASLDRGHIRRILPLLRTLVENTGVPMIYVSHDLGEILQLTQELVFIRDGKIVARGSFLDLISPSVLPLIHDLGLINVLQVEAQEHHRDRGITCLLPKDSQRRETWSAPLADKDEKRLFIQLRPEDIALVRHPITDTSIQNQIQGRIVRVIQADYRALVLVDVGVKILAEVTPHAVVELNLKPGQDITCIFKAFALRYL